LVSIIRKVKSRRMRWVGHVEKGETRPMYRLLVGKPEGKGSLGRPRWIILKWKLERQVGVVWTGLVWLRIGTSGELL
jgi:hypothetical protein